jgi:hypothetical protein
MAYTIKGTYAAVCDCRMLCPCPVDGLPTGEGDQCHGVLVFDIREGNLDDTDLSGVPFALYNHFPSNLSSGNWKVGIVVDDGASEEQAKAVERIISGEEGGPFKDFTPLIGDYIGMQRGKVGITNGDSPSISVANVGEDLSTEFVTGADGAPTTVSNAMFGFAPTFRVGKGSGRFNVFGKSHEARYAEGAEFEFSTEMAEGAIHPRA